MRDLRISVIDACNLRCTYCMPKESFGERYQFLTQAELLSFDEIARLARLFVTLGVTKLRITGGEPLLRKDIPELVAQLSRLEGVDDLALTTNGLLLPKYAQDLAKAGLHRVTVSLDTLDNETFQQMSGRDADVADVLKGIEAAEAAGLGPIKMNVVVQRSVNDDVLEMVKVFRHTNRTLRFIEYMDVGTKNHWRMDDVTPSAVLLDQINARYPVEPVAKDYRGEVADRYRFKDGAGEIGFISSVTQPFCGDCTRARLSADGKLFTCLFGATGTDFRAPLRDGASDHALLQKLKAVWWARDDRYSELRAAGTPQEDRVEMYQIGG